MWISKEAQGATMKRLLFFAILLLALLPRDALAQANVAVFCAVPGSSPVVYLPCGPTNPMAVAQISAGTTITGNSTGTTGAVVGTLAGVAGKTTYICGFSVSAIGGTATVGPITIANTVTASLVFYIASTATGNTLTQSFTPCIPASAANTAITTTTTADGTATAVTVNSWGFQL